MKPDQISSLHKAIEMSGPNSVFVEVGTWTGDFTDCLLKNCDFKKIYCVDPYKHFTDDSYPDAMNNLSQDQFEELFEKTKQRLSMYGSRVEFIRLPSTEASKIFEDNSIDFVYIDGNHDYKFVNQDIQSWFPKVKVNGYLCGDDVYSLNMSDYDSDNNLIKIWSPDGSCWGKYGTYPACIDNEGRFGIKFNFEDSQFSVRK